MRDPLISIIVPVFNAELFIHKCLDSIKAQSFTNWECILVDDGSTDESGKICDEFSRNDNRIKVIHKENGGLGSARNAGLDAAQGDFIWFYDVDDEAEDPLENEGSSESYTNSDPHLIIIWSRYGPLKISSNKLA